MYLVHNTYMKQTKKRTPLTEEQKKKAYEQQQKWVSENREKHNAAVRRYRAKRSLKEGRWRDEGAKAIELKRWMIELKSEPCSDCGNTFDTCCMDLDHKEGTEKTYNIGTMFAHHYSKELIQTELDKCELVCANCHRIRTRERRIGNEKKRKIT